MVIIYHSRDLDGFTSGAIAKLKYPDAKLIGFDYGQRFPMEEIEANEPVIMVDVSLPMDKMLELAKLSGWNMTWVDHHASAIKDYKNFTAGGEDFLIPVLEDGIAACEGTWKHMFPGIPIPRAVELLGEYDTWRRGDIEKWETAIMPFQYGMRLICSSPETFPTDLFGPVIEETLDLVAEAAAIKLEKFKIIREQNYEGAAELRNREKQILAEIALIMRNVKGDAYPIYDEQSFVSVDDTIFKIIDDGNTILKYQAAADELNCRRSAFERVIDFGTGPVRAICLNGSGYSSQTFKTVYDESKHDIMLPFQFNGKAWMFSMYTTKDNVDCSALCKLMGGGGHKKAAGFEANDLDDVFRK